MTTSIRYSCSSSGGVNTRSDNSSFNCSGDSIGGKIVDLSVVTVVKVVVIILIVLLLCHNCY